MNPLVTHSGRCRAPDLPHHSHVLYNHICSIQCATNDCDITDSFSCMIFVLLWVVYNFTTFSWTNVNRVFLSDVFFFVFKINACTLWAPTRRFKSLSKRVNVHDKFSWVVAVYQWQRVDDRQRLHEDHLQRNPIIRLSYLNYTNTRQDTQAKQYVSPRRGWKGHHEWYIYNV